jgi:hypothetical protein
MCTRVHTSAPASSAAHSNVAFVYHGSQSRLVLVRFKARIPRVKSIASTRRIRDAVRESQGECIGNESLRHPYRIRFTTVDALCCAPR